ncbi:MULTISPECIES: DNA recombination protein RmuC [unclassified Caballeronia]|uniref:DNA recombination protein RmuC n=1 Tax=unclassified Caballeronia TaxID=2646786 RepID=UPI00286628E7|nr:MULTISPECIES: DNA recombination protein RmuC [unclassified Caballeronia]MDR5750203.1 DNA recombination protein RmuC [Caballeronia sp. LZ024]MDR5842668.1 DNA recombination protein RmuC [Caballeronia sp. LZ031]
MNLSIAISAFLVAGLVLGAVAVWLVMRGRTRLQIESAVAQAYVASQVEFAQKDERLKAAVEEVSELKGGREQSVKLYGELRAELDQSRDEQARLTERSLRVPNLEAEVQALHQRINGREEELRNLATSEAQKGQLVSSLNSKVGELEAEIRALSSDASLSNSALNEANKRTATLEEQAARIPGLETANADLSEQVRKTSEELRRVAASEAQHRQLAQSTSSNLEKTTVQCHEVEVRLKSVSKELQDASERRATLEEQVARIPGLEVTNGNLTEEVRKTLEELRRVSASEAQQRQLAESTSGSLEKATAQLRDVEGRYKVALQELQEANERKATLEEQAAQIPTLVRKLGSAEARLLETSNQFSELRETSGRSNGQLSAELSAEKEACALVRKQYESEYGARRAADADVARLTEELTELRTSAEAEQKHAEEKLHLLTQAKEELSAQFKTLATEILEEKSKRFTEQNQSNLDQLLEPLKTRLREFQGKVEEVYIQEGKDRTALAEQVKQLHALNQALSEDAKNLTSALKGSSKTQGNWGELILERVLESSGLRKGHEYLVQDSQTREDGSRAQPDVVILLPEERKLVVDSKVSLVAYEAYSSAESDERRSISLRQHVESIRGHIKSLSDKQYHALYGKSLDFVLAFVPIEPAFMLAITNDKDIFMEALNRNVLLVSPSTLLFVVRTVAHLWRQEAQNRNAQDIARRGAELYDKLCGFVGDFENFGNRLKQAQSAYDAAHGKLVSGKGNVIRQAEMLRELGVKPSKALPAALVETSNEDGDAIIVSGALIDSSSGLGLTAGHSNQAPMSNLGD